MYYVIVVQHDGKLQRDANIMEMVLLSEPRGGVGGCSHPLVAL